MMLLLAGCALVTLILAWLGFPRPLPGDAGASARPPSPGEALRLALAALRRPAVWRWIILLEFSDLMLDVLYSYLALYLVDVVGLSPTVAALGVAVWSGVGLLGDFLLIPLLEKVKGLDYLRVSVVLELLLFPAFLLAGPLWLKFGLLGLLGFFNSGWYSVLKGKQYDELEGQSSSMLVLDNVGALIGKLIPLGLGLAAQRLGLGAAMWLLLLGPIALLVGLPRAGKAAVQPHSR
jgi:FSR family fosmidomycin resistance protein-like MFS transporter